MPSSAGLGLGLGLMGWARMEHIGPARPGQAQILHYKKIQVVRLGIGAFFGVGTCLGIVIISIFLVVYQFSDCSNLLRYGWRFSPFLFSLHTPFRFSETLIIAMGESDPPPPPRISVHQALGGGAGPLSFY